MIKSHESYDLELACKLQEQEYCLGLTENAVLSNNVDKESYEPRTLIDQTLELIDPTPNIHTLFVQFNERFFWNVLNPVEVKWGPRMTLCAGICCFSYKNRQCVITLSSPLLKLRPRKDLVETLLHEMIHAYLFLTNKNRDRNAHGPEFCKHMDRINKAGGTKITIYHSFHDEVRLYQQHWWRCNGPCQKRAPYFGTVRRAMNRAPGASDFWWKEHQRTCGGQFVKIKEPENCRTNSSKNKEKIKVPPKDKNSPSNISTLLTKATSPISELNPISTPKDSKVVTNNQGSLNALIRVGSTRSTSHTSNTGRLGSSNNSQSESKPNAVASTKAISPLIMPKSASTPKNDKSAINIQSTLNGFIKLGNGTNNVHGLGAGRRCSSTNSTSTSSRQTTSTTPKFFYSGVLGGSNNGQSYLLNKLYNDNNRSQSLNKNIMLLGKTSSTMNTAKIGQPVVNNKQFSNEVQIELVECPICCNFMPNDDINKHLDSCSVTEKKMLDTSGGRISTKSYDNINCFKSKVGTNNSSLTQNRKSNHSWFSNKSPKLDALQNSKKINCPVCKNSFDCENINEHLDLCLLEINEKDNIIELHNTTESINDSIISVSSTSTNPSSSSSIADSKNSYSSMILEKTNAGNCVPYNCLVCNELIPSDIALDDHLEDCIGNVFNEDSSLSIEDDNVKTSDMDLAVSIDDNNKYPCPVCMHLIAESIMNKHLDACLLNT